MTLTSPAALTAALLATLPVLAVQASPVINEFLAENTDFSADEDGDFSDWLEIFNPADEPFDLSGYTLTDNAEEPNKWTLPDITLAPGGYLLVFASGKDRTAADRPLHTNFALDGGGEFLGLYAPESSAAISSYGPEIPAQRKNIAYGITADSPDDVGFLLTPTPSGRNGTTTHGFVADTQFSVHRGFHTEPITVEISTATEGAAIRYTLDGSEPSEDLGLLYTEPLPLDSTTILRAVAVRDRFVSSNVDTQTYLFARDIKAQITLDARVTEAPDYADQMEQALGATLPALSVVAEDALLFGAGGIYTQFERSGRGAEVPISLEYFSPTDPDDTFHLRAGIRIHGGNARSHPKKPFRLYFRKEYSGGRGELEHRLYAGSNVNSFEQLILRSCGHDSWSLADRFGGSDFDLPAHASFLRDQFLRQTENDMGLLSPLGKYVHLYINGTYWGIYDMHERPNATYFSDHLGGDESDWDVVHHPEFADETYSVVSGNPEAWEALQSIATGQVADAIGFERIQNLVNLDGYIDSMIVRMWSGDYDWCGPVYRGIPAGNQTVFQNVTVFGNKNWYAGRRSRNGGDGKFHFFSWDAEMSMGLHLMFNLFGNSSQRVLNLDLSRVNDPGSPVAPYDALIAYPPFQRAFADRINKHLFNGGALTPDQSRPRLQALIDQLALPIIAESARWGNTAPNGRVFTKNADWLPEVEWLRDTFLVERGEKMLEGFREREIFPIPSSPAFSQPGGFLAQGASLTLSTKEAGATIYYTTDGTDPAELPEIELLQVLQPNASCVWLVPNASNGGMSSQFRWNLASGYPNEQFWWNGRIGLGFDNAEKTFKNYFNTDVQSVMKAAQGNGLYCRVSFGIPSQNALDTMDALILRLRYDDGFVAYINGIRVAASNAPAQPDARSAALEARRNEDAIVEEAFDVTDAVRNRLVVGSNVLALHGLNNPEDADDFLLAPRMELRQQLSAGGPSKGARTTNGTITLTKSSQVKARVLDQFGRWSALSEAHFHLEAALQPGDIAVTEIHYRPSAPRTEAERAVALGRSDFEFLEIRNQRDSPVELGQASLSRGVRFTFPQTQLAPGERALIVHNQAAFTARYGTDLGARILGTFQRDSKLSDMGETLTLVSREGATVFTFRYNDKTPWPEMADGEGASLLYHPVTADGDPGNPLNWAASLDPDGYPGQSAYTRYADWQTHYFAAEETPEGTFDADPDGDGLTNVLEYVFASHPLRPTEKTDFMAFSSRTVAGEEQAVFAFLRRPGMEDIQFSVEFSSDLLSWELTDLAEEDLLIEANVNSRERASVPLSAPLSVNGYGRLRVTLTD